MAITNAMRDFIAADVIGEVVTEFTTANAVIGVGNGTVAFAASQTNLQGASRLRKAMDGGYPTRATNVLTFRSTFATGEANFAWEEWGVFNNVTDASGTMFNRKVEALGTKTSAQSWQITVTLTVTAA